MSYSYYEDLSADERDEDSDESSACSRNRGDEVVGSKFEESSRIILHVDVDCFYCQSETLDRNLPPERPLAIGQKHIIVTCNYVAREQYGIRKLQSRKDALRNCPGLLIVDGSDLERYRQHARKIYESFRKACKSTRHFAQVSKDADVAVCKGSMDEMMADLSTIESFATSSEVHSASDKKWLYVFGDSGDKRRTIIREDQSGDTISFSTNASTKVCKSSFDRSDEKKRFTEAATWAYHIRQTIYEETGFKTTLGLSSNRLLAKIASGLKKPGGVNVLLPSRSEALLLAMPLRSVPGLGHRTYKALKPCLQYAYSEQRHGVTSPDVWTCRDLLLVPRNEILGCLKKVPAFQKNRGEDFSVVLDDGGGLPKTVSVENSFRRGTVCSREALQGVVEDLCERLPRLVKDRKAWSPSPQKAYPILLRITLRSVDNTISSRRPFVTHCKQTAIDGANLFGSTSLVSQRDGLHRSVEPLLESLLAPFRKCIDVTRLNVCVGRFQDIPVGSISSRQQPLSKYVKSPSKVNTQTS